MPKRDLPRTEAVNPVTKGIDAWSASSIVQAMSAEDHQVAPAVAREIPRIVEAVLLVVRAIRDSKRVLYAGAGTSGRLGILDASEMEPTFGAPGQRFTAIIAGGPCKSLATRPLMPLSGTSTTGKPISCWLRSIASAARTSLIRNWLCSSG